MCNVLILSRCLSKVLIFTTKVGKTGHIPKPAALDDLVGSLSAFCACVPYICMVHLHKCLEISPTGLIPLTMRTISTISTISTNRTIIYMNFENWK